MTRPIAVLRPAPGNGETAARIEARGLTAIRLPLFAVVPIDWTPPDPEAFDALVITSANTLRHGGPGLAALWTLPVLAVGAATARAATAAGFDVRLVGKSNAAALLAEAVQAGFGHALHLGGRDVAASAESRVICSIAVYASEPVDPAPEQIGALSGSVAMIHSPRAGARLAALLARDGVDRASVALAAISPAAAAAAGPGWHAVATAHEASDAALIDAAIRLAD